MKSTHLSSELAFYLNAFSNNNTRRKRKYSWEKNPSKVVIELARANGLNKDTKGKRVLDIGCGDGRHSKYFISLGYQIVGVDFCKKSIDICTSKFKNGKAKFYVLDLTNKGALTKLGKFDIIIDWSVLDHIRSEYLKNYLENIHTSMTSEGYLFITAFNDSLPGLFKNKKYKIKNGHYSKGYSINELIKLFPHFHLIDKRENVLEDKINNYRFHTILIRK
jgi:2-polyprenyl-3-methyl-5-hydroxy-6-metoxy-1,4-benzoquinol methylase